MFANIGDTIRYASRSWIGRLLIFGTGTYAAILVLGMIWEPARRVCLRRYHTDLPFFVWACLQPMPSMYNYDNVAIYQSGDVGKTKQINHHSYRVFGDFSEWWHAEHQGEAEMELTSRFLGTEVATRFRIITDEEGNVVVER